MNLSDLIISPESFGRKLLLLDVRPIYEYQKGVKQDGIVVGHRFVIVCVDRNYEKISVRIDGPMPPINAPDTPSEVIFDGLEIKAYDFQGKVTITAKANNVKYAKKGES